MKSQGRETPVFSGVPSGTHFRFPFHPGAESAGLLSVAPPGRKSVLRFHCTPRDRKGKSVPQR